MLPYFLAPLAKQFKLLNLLNYITFRAAGAAVTAFLLAFVLGPIIIRRLKGGAVTQGIRQGTPDTHTGKGNTPTMGGLIILLALFIATALWSQFMNRYVLIAALATLWMGLIGFVDDSLKLKQKREGKKNEGLVERYKLIGQVAAGLLIGLYIWQYPLDPNLPGASTTVPFLKYRLAVPISAGFAWIYVVFTTFVLTGTSNSVNLTDGLDGLAAGLSAISFMTFAVFAYLIGRVDASAYLGIFYLRGAGELTVFCAGMLGALLGFLWYNAHPAEVFMGDTGSLAIGGALGAVAILLKSEFLLVFIGGVFVCETLSVMIQRTVFKVRRKRHGLEYARAHRVFLRAPIHHHFELKGWTEPQVVIRFWIWGIVCAFIALSMLKVR